MIHYLTGQSEAHIRAVLISLYEATLGQSLPADPATGQKIVPQNDGRIQFHSLFGDWVLSPGVPGEGGQWAVPPVLKAGYHCALGIIASPQNPQGLIGPNDAAALSAAGIEVLREDAVDATLLPKFQ